MPPKKILYPFLALVIIFVSMGDSFTFLPKPARDASVTSRNFLISLWPQWLKPRDTNQQRDKQIDKLGL